jgi:hypothetical protein
MNDPLHIFKVAANDGNTRRNGVNLFPLSENLLFFSYEKENHPRMEDILPRKESILPRKEDILPRKTFFLGRKTFFLGRKTFFLGRRTFFLGRKTLPGVDIEV